MPSLECNVTIMDLPKVQRILADAQETIADLKRDRDNAAWAWHDLHAVTIPLLEAANTLLSGGGDIGRDENGYYIQHWPRDVERLREAVRAVEGYLTTNESEAAK